MANATENRGDFARIPIVILVLWLFTAVLGASRCHASDASPTLSLEPSSSCIAPGQSCTLSVVVDDAVDSLSCVFCTLYFDPSVVSCTTVEEGELYANAPYSTFFNWELIAPDSLRVEDCVLGHRSFILAPGELYILVFEGVQNGSSPVAIAEAEVYDIDRNELSVDLAAPAVIWVNSAAGIGEGIPASSSFRCRPNPFNSVATLTFTPPTGAGLRSGDTIQLLICSVAGGVVRRLYRGPLGSGTNTFSWNGKNDAGVNVSAGVYVAVLRTQEMEFKGKLILTR